MANVRKLDKHTYTYLLEVPHNTLHIYVVSGGYGLPVTEGRDGTNHAVTSCSGDVPNAGNMKKKGEKKREKEKGEPKKKTQNGLVAYRRDPRGYV